MHDIAFGAFRKYENEIVCGIVTIDILSQKTIYQATCQSNVPLKKL